jgi:hypothetical protein
MSTSEPHSTMAETIAAIGGNQPWRTFRKQWGGGAFVVHGRRNSPTAQIEKIPSAAAPFFELQTNGTLTLHAGSGPAWASSKEPRALLDQYRWGLSGKPTETWYDVRVSVPAGSTNDAQSTVKRRNPAGRPPDYDWGAFAKLLAAHVEKSGRFESLIELKKWAVGHVELKKGKRRPNGDVVAMKTVEAAISKYGLDKIGLSSPAG